MQGTDYAYTLHGWIKGVNSNVLKDANDIGHDGTGALTSSVGSGLVNKFNGRDVYGYSLTYFNNSTQKDYKGINGLSGTATDFMATAPSVQSPDLYNGNIRQMASSYLDASSPGKTYGLKALLRNFTYDQLNRIETAGANDNLNAATNAWGTTSSASLYAESFAYDQNGNIKYAQRNGNQSGSYAMDNLTYHYYPNTNQLAYVADAITGDPYSSDISNQLSVTNYTYDAIGNLTGDNAEGISNIQWTVYGKIKQITFTNGKPNLYFKYDASGNRISKIAYHGSTMTGTAVATYYVRDAQGNVMATYEQKPDVGGNATFGLAERHIYGSSRLGVDNSNVDFTSNIVTPLDITSLQRKLNYRSYELSNHLGNVLAVVSDRKIAVDAANDGVTDYFTGEVLSANDYYAFGATMPGRNFTSSSYRYGFNGKENDKETNTQDYGFRIYNPALGKFLSVDPLTKEYPWNSTYAFAENDVVRCIDIEGKEKYYQNLYFDENGNFLYSDPIIEVEVAGPKGDGFQTNLYKAYQSGGLSGYEPVAEPYFETVNVTPQQTVSEMVEDCLKDADAFVSQGGDIRNSWEDHGRDGQTKWFARGHDASDKISEIPIVGEEISGALDAVLLIGETARDVEDGNYMMALTRIGGELLGAGVDKVFDKTKEFKGKDELKEIVDDGVEKVTDKAMEEAEKLDKNDL